MEEPFLSDVFIERPFARKNEDRYGPATLTLEFAGSSPERRIIGRVGIPVAKSLIQRMQEQVDMVQYYAGRRCDSCSLSNRTYPVYDTERECMASICANCYVEVEDA